MKSLIRFNKNISKILALISFNFEALKLVNPDQQGHSQTPIRRLTKIKVRFPCLAFHKNVLWPSSLAQNPLSKSPSQ